jgi:hypothetical protein
MAPHSEPGDTLSTSGNYGQNYFDVPLAEIPVLIVGGGSSGLLQAYMLSQLGGSDLLFPLFDGHLFMC